MFVWAVLGGSSRHYGTTNGLVFEADIFTKVRISNLKTEVIRPKPELHQNASCRGHGQRSATHQWPGPGRMAHGH